MTPPRSKSLPSANEWEMYLPFAEALNYALEQLSDIQVDELPEFKSHIAFVPCNKRVEFDRNLRGYLLKPDIALMSIRGACEFYELDRLDVPTVSKFVSKITGKSPPALPTGMPYSQLSKLNGRGMCLVGPRFQKRLISRAGRSVSCRMRISSSTRRWMTLSPRLVRLGFFP